MASPHDYRRVLPAMYSCRRCGLNVWEDQTAHEGDFCPVPPAPRDLTPAELVRAREEIRKILG